MSGSMIAVILAAVLAGSGTGASSGEKFELPLTPSEEVRARALGKELRCAVCQGMSISDSPSAVARSQFGIVREMISQGKSDDEIRRYFVARYGEWVLLEPTANGTSWLMWAGPIGFVLIGGLIIWRTSVKKGSADPKAA